MSELGMALLKGRFTAKRGGGEVRNRIPVIKNHAGLRWIFGLLILALLAGGIFAQEEGEEPLDSPYAGDSRLAIPEFPDGLEWVNVAAPLTKADLRGKIVVMDFWTYGCINCIHMIPVLQQLEQEYADVLVVIGVHSAKFSTEGETTNIQQVVQRYDVHHPVINDHRFIVWQMYGAQAWPTFAVIDPHGNLLARQSGEIPYEAFKQLLDGMVEFWDSVGELNREPLAIAPEGANAPNSLLRYPGKVLADVDGSRLFIADSSNNRIIIADLTTYEVLDVIGTGAGGFTDGDFDAAAFNKPQGLALRENRLVVADTNNHAIRLIDLENRRVQTLAGTGRMGRGINSFYATIREPLTFDLRSPWDVEFGEGSTLYIAMAGTHQIWEMDVDLGLLKPSVGYGKEGMFNQRLESSELAQPSGLYYEDGRLYFADSESSTIRMADYNEGEVRTISGTTDNNLFDFGDVDGALGDSRLQHPLGVDGDGAGLIYVADTYNSRIKTIDLTNHTETLAGLGGAGGYKDGTLDEAEFDEPGGLDYVELPDGSRRIYVADTNNHAIRVIDLDAGLVSTVNFLNPQALQIADRVTVIGGNRGGDETLSLDEQTLAAGDAEIVLKLDIPEGYKLNPLAQSLATWRSEDETITITDEHQTIPIDRAEVRVPVVLSTGTGRLYGELTIYFCEAVNESLCFIDLFRVEVPVTVGAAGRREITITRALVPPELDSVGGV